MIEPIGKQRVREGDVLANDPHVRLPEAAVEMKLNVGVDQPFGLEVLPLLLQRAGQDRQ